MEPTTVAPALSIRQLLAPSEHTAKAHLNERLDAAVTLQVGVPRDTVIEALLGLFDIPLADILFPAWQQFGDVRQAMARTREEPGTVRQVRVGAHTLKSKHHPKLECDLDDVKVFELELELELLLHFAGAVVTVTQGEITSIGPGDATLSASLKSAGGLTLIPGQQLILVFSQPVTRGQPPAPQPAQAASRVPASI